MSKNTKIIVGIVVVVAIIAVIYAFNSKKAPATTAANTTSDQTAAAGDLNKMLSQVGEHIVLPTDETPTAAVVSDLSKLKSQPFFDRAQLGDVVLVYANARRVILWRPSVQKIVEVSAINIPETATQTATDTKKK